MTPAIAPLSPHAPTFIPKTTGDGLILVLVLVPCLLSFVFCLLFFVFVLVFDLVFSFVLILDLVFGFVFSLCILSIVSCLLYLVYCILFSFGLGHFSFFSICLCLLSHSCLLSRWRRIQKNGGQGEEMCLRRKS
jgi:hypothetical protein